MALTLLERIRQKAQEAANYFNPDVAGGFWNTPFANSLGQAQQTVQKIPQQVNEATQRDLGLLKKYQDQGIYGVPLRSDTGPLDKPLRDSGWLGNALATLLGPTPREIEIARKIESGQRISPDEKKFADEQTLQLVAGMSGGVKGVGNAADDILRGTNAPLKTTERFFANKGAKNVPSFIADAEGQVSKVIKGGRKTQELFKNVEKNVLKPSDEVRLLSAGESAAAPHLLPETTNPILANLRAKSQSIQQLVNSAEKAVAGAKGGARKTAEYLFGGKDIKGARGVLANESEVGKTITNIVNEAEQETALLKGGFKDTLNKAFAELDDTEMATLSDVIEGKLEAVSPAQQQVADVWKKMAGEIHELATGVGIKAGKIKNYFPHFMDQGGVRNLDEEFFFDRGSNINFGNLVKSRVASDAPYIKDPRVLFDYIDHAVENIGRQAFYGQGDENLYKLAQKTANPKQALSIVDTVLGKNKNLGGLGEKVSRKITDIENFKLGPVSPFTNLTQQLSAVMRTDVPTAIRTYAQWINDPATTISRAIKAGEIDPTRGSQLLDSMNQANKTVGSKWLDLIRFNLSEKANRIFAVNSGYNYAEKLMGQAVKGSKPAVRELERLGIKNIAQVTEDDLLKAGRKVALETQFSNKAGTLPEGWTTNVGRVATQFKGFAYKQTGFWKDNLGRITSEASKGNVKPLVNALTIFGVATPLIGEIVGDVRSLITNKKRTESGVRRYVQNIAYGTSFGLLDNLPALIGKYGESGIVSTLGGPFAGDVSKVAGAVSDISQAASGQENVNLRPAARTALRFIPGAGPALANTLVPNAYVENYAGQNVGLEKSDKETYEALKKTDPAAAEKFRTDNLAVNKPQETPSLAERLFGKKEEFDWNATPTSKKAKTAFNGQVDKALELGAEVPDKALNTRFFEGRDYQSATSNSDREKVMQSALKVAQDEYLTPEQKVKILTTAKVSQTDLDYYTLASMDEADKMQGVIEFVANNELDHDQLIQTLALNKRRVAGKYIMTSGVVDRLYDEGYISKADKALLTALKWDSVYNKFYMDRDYKGSGTGLTPSKLKSYVTSVNSIFKASNLKSSTKTTESRLPKAPKVRPLSPLTK